MKRLFSYADQYVQESNWKHLAMLKFCLFSIGILVGIQIPEKNKKRAGLMAGFLFLVTYIPLMTKFIRIVRNKEE